MFVYIYSIKVLVLQYFETLHFLIILYLKNLIHPNAKLILLLYFSKNYKKNLNGNFCFITIMDNFLYNSITGYLFYYKNVNNLNKSNISFITKIICFLKACDILNGVKTI